MQRTFQHPCSASHAAAREFLPLRRISKDLTLQDSGHHAARALDSSAAALKIAAIPHNGI